MVLVGLLAVCILITTVSVVAASYLTDAMKDASETRLRRQVRKTLGPAKVTVIAVGGVLAVIIPGPLTQGQADLQAPMVEAAVQRVVEEEELERRVWKLEPSDLRQLEDPESVPAEELDALVEGLEEEGYEVTLVRDPFEARAIHAAAEASRGEAVGVTGVLLQQQE